MLVKDMLILLASNDVAMVHGVWWMSPRISTPTHGTSVSLGSFRLSFTGTAELTPNSFYTGTRSTRAKMPGRGWIAGKFIGSADAQRVACSRVTNALRLYSSLLGSTEANDVPFRHMPAIKEISTPYLDLAYLTCGISVYLWVLKQP